MGSCADGGHKTTSGDRRTKREAGRCVRRRGLGLKSPWSLLAALPFVPERIGTTSEQPWRKSGCVEFERSKGNVLAGSGGLQRTGRSREWYYPAGLVLKVY